MALRAKNGMCESTLTFYLTPKSILIIILSIQSALLGTIGLEKIGLGILILRQLIGFIYLTFVPGFLLFCILEINNLSNINKVALYSAGLSLSLLMFTGFLISLSYPLIGISKPISETSLIVTITVIVTLLCCVFYIRNKGFSITLSIHKERIFSPCVFSLLLLPFLAIFGTYFLNFYDNNFLLIILLVVVSAIPIIINKFPEYVYSTTVWVIAISLLLYISLDTIYIRFTDVTVEILLCNLTITNGFWDPAYPGSLYSMLGVTVLYPIYSLVSGIDLTWTVKVILPLLYSLVPLTLYYVYKQQTNEKIAFLSCFFFMGMYEFYTWAGVTMKTVSSGLFLALFLLLIADDKMDKVTRRVLLIIFTLSLTVSHYGTSYIFMFCILGSLIILLVLEKMRMRENHEDHVRVIAPAFVVLYITFAISWYIYTVGGSWFAAMVNIGNHIITSILTGYILPEGSYALEILISQHSFSLQALKVLLILFAIFMIIGIMAQVCKTLFKFKKEYEVLSLSFAFASSTIFVGYASGMVTPDRMYHLISYCLAPFSIIGGSATIEGIAKFFKHHSNKAGDHNYFKVLSILLIAFFLFNSGFISDVIMKDYPGAPVYISKSRIIGNGSPAEKRYLHWTYATEYCVESAKWLAEKRDVKLSVIADITSIPKLKYCSVGNALCYGVDVSRIQRLSYVYLDYFNVIDGLFASGKLVFNITDALPELGNYSKIYTNGYSEIYYYC